MRQRGRGAISELESLLARLERALDAIERQRTADQARLARIEQAAHDTVAALDALLAQDD